MSFSCFVIVFSVLPSHYNESAQETTVALNDKQCHLENECKERVPEVVTIQPDESNLSANVDVNYTDDKMIVVDDSERNGSTSLGNGK